MYRRRNKPSRLSQMGYLFLGAKRSLLGGGKWTPQDWFRNNEQGAVYDPADLTDAKLTFRRNLLSWSEDFTNATWVKTGSTAPANVLMPSAVAEVHHIAQAIPSTTQALFVEVVVEKLGVIDKVTLFPGSSATFCNFNLTALTATREGGTTSASIEALGSNQYKLTAVWPAGAAYDRLRVYASSGSTGAAATAGDGVSGVKLIRAQLEVGTATPYQKITDYYTEFLQAFPTHSLFQDSAGVLPVTAIGQPCGLMLDRRFGGVRGAEVVDDGGFNNPARWNAIGSGTPNWVVAAGVATAEVSTSASRYLVYMPGGTVADKVYEFAFTILTSNGVGGVRFGNGTDNSCAWATTPGPVRFVMKAAGATPTNLWIQANGNWAGSIDNISVREIPGNHATQPTAINRPILQIDGNGKYYLAFNGTNSWMSTGSIDFTGTDKVTVVAGVRKLSDAATGVLIELSASSSSAAGTFALFLPLSSASTDIVFRGGGASIPGNAATKTGVTAPVTQVVTGGSVAGSATELRLNGTLAASGGVNTGAYANQALYIGARGGSSLFFNGSLYGLIVRGAASSASQIASAEKFMNAKTGAF